jgi:hypothetical protein
MPGPLFLDLLSFSNCYLNFFIFPLQTMRLARISLLLGFTLLSASPGYAQDPAFEWVASRCPNYFSGGYRIAHDDLGNVYVTGRFTGTIDVDPGAAYTNLTSAGALDTYITKVDARGKSCLGKKSRWPQ